MVAGEDAIRQFLPSYTTNGDIWKSPFFFSPTLLLLYIAIICLYSSYRAPYQPDNTPNTQNRNSKLLFKLVFFFSCLISLTLLTDIMVIIARLMKDKMLTPVLGYYSSMSFLIWISNTYYLMKKANKFSMWQTFQSSFYGLAIIGETMIGWLWLMAMMQSGQSK
jgi:ATP-binding cassette subfamily B (MDR/TAP) protein 6